jgi:hypothetical protein
MSANLFDLINTPERRVKARALQQSLRERFGAALHKHPAEINYYYGVNRERMVLNQLATLENASASDERVTFLLNQLGEGLALQGRFREAAKATRSEPHREEYLRKAEALERLGQDCDCPVELVLPSSRDAKGERIPARIHQEVFFDGERHITLTHCLICKGIRAIA